MSTTIQISDQVKKALDQMKLLKRESYNDIIELLIEDNLEIKDEVKEDIKKSRRIAEKGETYSQEEVERMFGL